MKRMFIVYAMLMLACTINNDAQAKGGNNDIQRYIERYRSLAMSEQQRTGIPAAIKLAQGIHETGAGTSALATEANNHFGLKCKAGWQGQTFMHDDDKRDECFRKYNMDFESYQDQSNYLKGNPRYASLFSLSVTDYAAWAFGLRKAGYATNPKYPELLIKLIEENHLQEYTYAAMSNDPYTANTTPSVDTRANDNPRNDYRNNTQQYNQPQAQQNNYGRVQTQSYERDNSRYSAPQTTTYNNTQPERISKYIDTRPTERQTITRSRQNGREVEQKVDNAPMTVVKINNLKAIYGKKGDMPLQYAVRNGIRYEKFLEMNDLKEEPLIADMPLYLERKHFWGIRPMHLVKYGEVMIEIAQKEGIQLKYLRDLNYMEEGEEPVPGITLELQAQAGSKPNVVKRSESPAYAQQISNQEEDKGDPEDNYNDNYSNAPQYAAPVSTFPKNPAPVYTEEKSLFDKIKETRLAKKLLKEQEEAEKQQMAKAQSRQPASQRTPSVQAPPQTQPESKYIPNTPPAQQQQVAQQPQQSRYIPNTPPPARQQPVAQQQTRQQPVQSYRSQQSSYPTTITTPNPAAQVVEEKSERELRREARRNKKNDEPEPVAKSTVPTVQKPKTELDLLKEQFDDVVYAQNANTGRPAARTQQQQYQQPQQTQRTQQTQSYQQQYQQPQQTQQTQQYREQPQYQQQNNQYQEPVQQYGQQNQYQAQQPQYQQQGQQYQQQNQYQSQPQYQQQGQQNQQYQQQQQPNYDPTKFYMVQRGDTAYTIAKKHGITIRQLMDWNGLDFDAIKEGQNLRVKQ